jgi:RNA polymerase sigma-70 factor (ECF subfamily)
VGQTPPSLLHRLQENAQDAEAWDRFDSLYRPLLQTWLRRYAVQAQDADDLVQQVLEVVVREMPNFHYDRQKGTFRGWLRAILVNRLRDFWRDQQARPRPMSDSAFFESIVNQLEDHGSDLAHLWDEEHDEQITQRLLGMIEKDFAPSTWTAFQRLLAGEKAAQIAAELGLSANAVYLAKSSVMKRLRQEMEGLLD